jgi:hypothetical protein
MRGFYTLVAAAALAGSASALDSVTVKGNAFYVGNERVCLTTALLWSMLELCVDIFDSSTSVVSTTSRVDSRT